MTIVTIHDRARGEHETAAALATASLLSRRHDVPRHRAMMVFGQRGKVVLSQVVCFVRVASPCALLSCWSTSEVGGCYTRKWRKAGLVTADDHMEREPACNYRWASCSVTARCTITKAGAFGPHTQTWVGLWAVDRTESSEFRFFACARQWKLGLK